VCLKGKHFMFKWLAIHLTKPLALLVIVYCKALKAGRFTNSSVQKAVNSVSIKG
jgi:hypothetical protein